MNTNYKNENWQTGDCIIAYHDIYYTIRYITNIDSNGIVSLTIKTPSGTHPPDKRFISYTELDERFRLLTPLEKVKYL